MSLPGFTAEISLSQTSERYLVAAKSSDAGAPIQAAGIFDIILDPCSYCFRNCTRQTKTPSGGRDCLMACNFAGLC